MKQAAVAQPEVNGLSVESLLATLSVLCLTVFAFRYFSYTDNFSVNMPNGDDFDMFIQFLHDFLDSSTFAEKLRLMLNRHAEHFIVANKVAALLSYYLLGHLDFRILILAGNLSIPIAIFLLFQLYCVDFPARMLGTAFAGICLLQPQYYQVSLWAGGSIENLWVMTFACGAFLFVTKQRNTLCQNALLLVLSLAAIFTQGNGLFVPLLVSIYLMSNRKSALGMAFLAIFAAVAAFHCLHTAPHTSASFSILDYLKYSLGFLGAPLAGTMSDAIRWGSLFLIAFLARFLVPIRSQGLALVASFVVLTAVANAMARIHLGIDYGFQQSRYSLPAIFFMVSVVLLLIEGIRPNLRDSVSLALLCCATIGALFSYEIHRVNGLLNRERLIESEQRWQIARTGLEYPDQDRAGRIYSEGLRRKTVLSNSSELAELPQPIPFSVKPVDPQQRRRRRMRGCLEWAVEGNRAILLSGYALAPSHQEAGETYIVLSGPSGDFRLDVQSRVRPDAAENHKLDIEDIFGFSALADSTKLPPGSYSIRLILGKAHVAWPNKALAINSIKVD